MRRDVVFTVIAFGLYGLSKLAFNVVAVHRLDPGVVGEINGLLALHTVLLVFTVQPIASVINRYIPTHVAAADLVMARRLLGSGLILTVVTSSVIAAAVYLGRVSDPASVGILGSHLLPGTFPYIWGYALYFYFKMAYYGHRRIGGYCLAELAGSLCFFASLWIAAVSKQPQAFIVPWVAQPIMFCMFAAWHFRHDFIWLPGAMLSRPWRREYLQYGLFWVTAAASGFGAYHLSILAATLLQPSASAVGFYAVSLSLLSPLSLLPTSISMVLFPRMTQNHACGEGPRNSALIRESTTTLALPLVASTIVCCGLAPEILALINVPGSWQNVVVLQLLTIGVSVSLVSTPAGSFLSATSFAGTSSIIGVCSLVLGIVTWVVLTPIIGVVGTAAGYSLLMAARGLSNMVVSHRHRAWWSWSARGAILTVGLVLVSTVGPYLPWPFAGRAALLGADLLIIGLLLLPEVNWLKMVTIGRRA